MSRDIKIIKEAAKAAKKKKEKPLDPNEEARKRNGLPKHHSVGRVVHAGLAVKGGAGYRGKVVKVDDTHTYIDIGGKRTVKAPHRLVSAHEEYVQEESKEEKKERLKREAEREAKSFRKYSKTENEKEEHDERRKRHHEHERKMHREETEVHEGIIGDAIKKTVDTVKKINTPQNRDAVKSTVQKTVKKTVKIIKAAKQAHKVMTRNDYHDHYEQTKNDSVARFLKAGYNQKQAQSRAHKYALSTVKDRYGQEKWRKLKNYLGEQDNKNSIEAKSHHRRQQIQKKIIDEENQ